MELKDYTTEVLKAELKRRSDLYKAEKAKIKRCRMCKHWGRDNLFRYASSKRSAYGTKQVL